MQRCWQADPAERPTFSGLASILDRILQLVAGYIELSMILPVHANEGNTGGYEGYEEVEVTDHERGKMSLRIMRTYKGQFCNPWLQVCV